MFKKQRKLFICFALLVATIGSGNNVSAATIEQNGTSLILVQSVNTASSRVGLSISNSGTASLSAGVVGKAGTSKIHMSIKLQKYNNSSKSWKNVKSWDKTANSANVLFNTTYKLDSKGTYRCKLSADVWKNGSKESVSITSDKKKY